MKIIEVRKNHIFIDKGNGEVGVEPNTPYFYHRLIVSNNERIFKEFPKDSITVQETFNEMIFNITVGNGVVTTRPSTANRLVQSLDDPEKIIDIFNEYRTNELNIKLLESILARYGERIKLTNEGFIVDNLFLVDREGCAFNWKNGDIDTSISTNLSNGGICIVVNKMSNQEFIDPMTSKTIKLDRLGYTILAKIQFLLNPNLNDSVFTNQVLPETLEILKRQNEEFFSDFK